MGVYSKIQYCVDVLNLWPKSFEFLHVCLCVCVCVGGVIKKSTANFLGKRVVLLRICYNIERQGSHRLEKYLDLEGFLESP